MKTIFRMMAAALLTAPALADQPVLPGADANATEVRSPALTGLPAPSEVRSDPLVPGPAVVTANRVNVRGQARLRSEVLTQLTNGEPVTVIEEVRLRRSAPDEPSAWAKIALPGKAPAWVHASYVDAATKTVTASKLNVRSGPGENFSVVGSLVKGDTVREIQSRGDWIQIEPPPGAYAFVAAQYLKQETPVIASADTVPTESAATIEIPVEETPVETATITETPVVAATTETPVIAPGEAGELTPVATNEMAALETAEMEEFVIDEPPPPRIVQREGIVRGTVSIQAPTDYALISPDTGRAINYLYTTSTNLDLSRYKGLHIIVTGEEGLDIRWKNTPIITIQRIQVLE
ncbi:MAG TPA: SH3 domain-containing protein [Verrucomicrobiota bacterium]|nr:SH3 domain-containing protein [Verrucomicrobiota bacterium]